MGTSAANQANQPTHVTATFPMLPNVRIPLDDSVSTEMTELIHTTARTQLTTAIDGTDQLATRFLEDLLN